jgi:hypothetical protein
MLEFQDFAVIAMIVAIFAGGTSAVYKAWSHDRSGVLVRLDPTSFLGIVGQQQKALVVYTTYRRYFFTPQQHRYLTSYKGLMFVAESDAPLDLPKDTEVVRFQQ